MPEPTTPELQFKRAPECISKYANNVQFEGSVWDLKLIFGELDQSKAPNSVEQDLVVTIPWQQARLAAYFLIVNSMIYEATNGRIPLPSRVIPPRPDPADPTLDETGKKVLAYLAWVHDQFFGANPYVPPGAGDLFGIPPKPENPR